MGVGGTRLEGGAGWWPHTEWFIQLAGNSGEGSGRVAEERKKREVTWGSQEPAESRVPFGGRGTERKAPAA